VAKREPAKGKPRTRKPAKDVGGRPTKYKDEYAVQAARLCSLGQTDQEIADFFQVSVRTLHRWKGDHKRFCHSLSTAKAPADTRVERSLYQRAIGYEQDAVKIFMPAGAEEPVYAPYRERIAPDTTAAIFWLKNRKPDEWRDRAVGEKDNPFHVAPGKHEATDAQLLAIACKGAKKDG
jgi:hypothetical protein